MEFRQVCSMPFHFRSTSHSIWKETNKQKSQDARNRETSLIVIHAIPNTSRAPVTGDVFSDCILLLPHAVVSASSVHSSSTDPSPPGQCGTAGRTLEPQSTGPGCSGRLLHLANKNLGEVHNHRSQSRDETLGR